MPNIQSLTSALGSYTSERKSDVYLVELGADDRPAIEAGKPVSLAFQYFPDTISDTKAVNYQQKEIPGGSLPLYQWINGGERLISFTAYFTSDVDLVSASSPSGLVAKAIGGNSNIRDRLRSAGEERSNVDIRSAVTWLRRYMFPSYRADETGGAAIGVPLTFAPRKLMLKMPNSGIGTAGGCTAPDSVTCVMTQCDVTYEKFFPSGLPRIASVSLAFAQVAQEGGNIWFPRRDVTIDDAVAGRQFYLGYTVIPRTKNGGS